jgi:hypothetical protein
VTADLGGQKNRNGKTTAVPFSQRFLLATCNGHGLSASWCEVALIRPQNLPAHWAVGGELAWRWIPFLSVAFNLSFVGTN